MFENYKNNEITYSYEERSEYVSNLIFDINNRYLVGYGDTQVLVMDLGMKEVKKQTASPTSIYTDERPKKWVKSNTVSAVKMITINLKKYEKIHHLRFNSFDSPNEIGDNYRCYVACKKKEEK